MMSDSTATRSWGARAAMDGLTRGVMYQVFLRSFTLEGTLRAATERLQGLAELGVGVLYLTPICLQDDDTCREFWSARQQLSEMDNPKNPYRIKDYYTIDPEYGTDDDLRDFADRAHELGMRVILDIVFMHCGPTANFI